MAKESPAKVKVKKLFQVAIAVKDIELVAENFWNILGIGPWAIFDWEAPFLYERTYYGEPAWSREKIALTQVGNVQLELVTAVDGPSLYGDWIEERGEGLHHINFQFDTVDEHIKAMESFANDGFTNMQGGRFGPPEKKFRYNYINIPPLRTIWEPVYEGPAGAIPKMVPDTTEESPAKVKVKSINQIAIVVKDVELVAQNFWNILGIGPWTFIDWELPLVYDRKYHGNPAWAREKIALADVGGVQLEISQPVDGPSIYGDWLEEHGEGLHHLNFLVDDVDETEKLLAMDGFKSLQGGRYGPPEQGGAFCYIDIPPLRSIWEPVRQIDDVHGNVGK